MENLRLGQGELLDSGSFLIAPFPDIDIENFKGEANSSQPVGEHNTEGFPGDSSKLVHLVLPSEEGLVQCFIPERIARKATDVYPAGDVAQGIYRVETPEANYLIKPEKPGVINFSGLEQEVTILPDGNIYRDERIVMVETKRSVRNVIDGILRQIPEEKKTNVGINGLAATFVRFDEDLKPQAFNDLCRTAVGKPTLAGTDIRDHHGVNADNNEEFDSNYSQWIAGVVVLTPDTEVFGVARQDETFKETRGAIAITVMGHAATPDLYGEAMRETKEEIIITRRDNGELVDLPEMKPIGAIVLPPGENIEGITELTQHHQAVLYIYKIDDNQFEIIKNNGENKKIVLLALDELENMPNPATWNKVVMELLRKHTTQ